MLTSNRSEERVTSLVQQSVEKAVAGPDLSWRGLYRAGGVSAILYVVLSLIVPTVQVLTMQYDFKMDGPTLLQFIASHRLWWMILQTLVLGTSILAIVSFVALFMALKHLNKSYAVIGTVIAFTCLLLFMAYYPVLLGLVYLSDQFVAATETQRDIFATAAESLIAQNNAFNPLYESLFGVSILILSLVMLKGVFHKSVAYLGVATCAAAFIGLALWPIVGVAYFWWWLLFMVWFIAVGWKLYRLGGV
ncbi:MAG: hypothetical protein BroJett011_67760 [Chloroflexota bacterium]|nr:MAG: hypothetical protein BroJett011_67760 [Chloroflexota bacterium]